MPPEWRARNGQCKDQLLYRFVFWWLCFRLKSGHRGLAGLFRYELIVQPINGCNGVYKALSIFRQLINRMPRLVPFAAYIVFSVRQIPKVRRYQLVIWNVVNISIEQVPFSAGHVRESVIPAGLFLRSFFRDVIGGRCVLSAWQKTRS